MRHLPKVAVIGAGSSGIAAVKSLHERGLDVTCYEASDRVGGNWVFGNRNGMSSSYRSLHINTSRKRMEYSDFPMPLDYPDFPRHDQIAAYFDSYVDHFGFRDRIRFETPVARAERSPEGTWTITTEAGDVDRYDALLVANGHHWDARWPEPAFPARTRRRSSRSTPTTTRPRSSSTARRSSSSGWATARWTSRWTPATTPSAPTSRRAAARGSSPSTSAPSRSTAATRSSPTRASRSASSRRRSR